MKSNQSAPAAKESAKVPTGIAGSMRFPAAACRAVANLAVFCRDHLADRYEIEAVDVFREP